MEEFINSQKATLGISDFLQNAQSYTQENFPNLDIDNLFTSAITGSISTNFWTTTILDLARKPSKRNSSAYDNSFNCNYYSQYFQSHQ